MFSGEAGAEEFYTNTGEGERDGRDGEIFKRVRQTEHDWEEQPLKHNSRSSSVYIIKCI